jgi:hypothetical protein
MDGEEDRLSFRECCLRLTRWKQGLTQVEEKKRVLDEMNPGSVLTG